MVHWWGGVGWESFLVDQDQRRKRKGIGGEMLLACKTREKPSSKIRTTKENDPSNQSTTQTVAYRKLRDGRMEECTFRFYQCFSDCWHHTRNSVSHG